MAWSFGLSEGRESIICWAPPHAALRYRIFFLLREENGRVACVGQRVVLIFVAFLTATDQILLTQAFKPLLRHLPAILGAATHYKIGPDNQGNRDLSLVYFHEASFRTL